MKTLHLVSIITAIGISLTTLVFTYQHIQNCEAEGGSISGFLACDKSEYNLISELFHKKYTITGGWVADGVNGATTELISADPHGNSITLLLKANQNGPYYAEILCKYNSGKTERITKNIVDYLGNDSCFRNAETSLPTHEQLNFTMIQFENGCTEDRVCYGVFENGTKMRISCDEIPMHSCGVISFDELAMPDDFSVIYSFGVGGKNVLDTKKMSYKSDMICEPEIEVNLKLSHNELYQIWDAAHKNDFFDLNDFTDNCDAFGNCKLVTPEQQTTITITEGGKTHSVTHRDSYVSKPNDGYAKFQKIADVIQDVLDKRPEIQNLPQLKCGYE